MSEGRWSDPIDILTRRRGIRTAKVLIGGHWFIPAEEFGLEYSYQEAWANGTGTPCGHLTFDNGDKIDLDRPDEGEHFMYVYEGVGLWARTWLGFRRLLGKGNKKGGE